MVIRGQQSGDPSTYTVRNDAGDNYAYIFTPDGLILINIKIV